MLPVAALGRLWAFGAGCTAGCESCALLLVRGTRRGRVPKSADEDAFDVRVCEGVLAELGGS